MCHHCMGVTACCLIVTRMGFPVGKSVLLLAFEVHEVVEKSAKFLAAAGLQAMKKTVAKRLRMTINCRVGVSPPRISIEIIMRFPFICDIFISPTIGVPLKR